MSDTCQSCGAILLHGLTSSAAPVLVASSCPVCGRAVEGRDPGAKRRAPRPGPDGAARAHQCTAAAAQPAARGKVLVWCALGAAIGVSALALLSTLESGQGLRTGEVVRIVLSLGLFRAVLSGEPWARGLTGGLAALAGLLVAPLLVVAGLALGETRLVLPGVLSTLAYGGLAYVLLVSPDARRYLDARAPRRRRRREAGTVANGPRPDAAGSPPSPSEPGGEAPCAGRARQRA